MLRMPGLGVLFVLLAAPALAQSDHQTVSDCESNDPGTAIAACTSIINGGPDMSAYSFEAYSNRAVAESKQGEFRAAIADATQAIALNPANAKTFATRAGAYAALKQPDLAISDANQSIGLNASEADAYVARGLAEGEKGQWDADIADQTQALGLAPANRFALLERATAQDAENKPTAEIADLNAVLARDPSNRKALIMLSAAYLKLQEPDQALIAINGVLAQDPGNVDAGINLGLYYGQKGQYQQEITQLSKMLQPWRLSKIGFGVLYINRAEAYGGLGNFDAAIQDASRAILVNPGDAVAWNDRCWFRANDADLADALTDCKKSLALAPNNPDTLDSTGFVYLKMHNDAASIRCYDAVLKIYPKVASSLYGRGLAEAELGEKAASAADIAAAKGIDPGIAGEM